MQNTSPLSKGDYVLQKNMNIRIKLDSFFNPDPCTVIEVYPHSAKIQASNGKEYIRHKTNLKSIKKKSQKHPT